MADWNPWQTLEMLRREIDNVFNETDSRREPVFRTAFLPGRAARRYPLINLCRYRGAVCRSPACGRARDAQCERRGEHLEHRREKRRVAGDVQPEAFHRSERATGKFVRHIALPIEVDENNVQADYTPWTADGDAPEDSKGEAQTDRRAAKLSERIDACRKRGTIHGRANGCSP